MNQDPEKEHPKKEGVRYSFGDDCRRSIRTEDAFDEKMDRKSVLLSPGESYCLDEDQKMLVAVVGAGVCMTIFDEKLHFGVMACPLMTPQMCAAFPKFDQIDDALIAKIVEPIGNAISEMKKHGAAKNRIRIRLFGGADLPDDEQECGTKNYVFVKEYLKSKQLSVMGEDIGGTDLRRVHFLPDIGSVTRFSLRRGSDFDNLKQAEVSYFGTL